MILNKVKMHSKVGKLSKNSKNQYSKVDVELFNTTKRNKDFTLKSK